MECENNGRHKCISISSSSSSSSNRFDKPWTSTSALVICPFVDFALACLVLGMATFFLVSRMTQLCNTLVSCWTGASREDEREYKQQQQPITENDDNQQLTRFVSSENQRCLTCQQPGRLNGICNCCIMQVLGLNQETNSSSSRGSRRPLILQEILLGASSEGDKDTSLASFAIDRADRMRRDLALFLENLRRAFADQKMWTHHQQEACNCCRQQQGTGSSCREQHCDCWRQQKQQTCKCSKPADLLQLHADETDKSQTPDEKNQGEVPQQEPADSEEQRQLREALHVEREVIDGLYYELEQERNASAVAANESIAMITRLQEEKASLLMEARQYQRIVEEKAFHDHKAITILKEMLLKREAEKVVLEEEIDLYRKSAKTNKDNDSASQGEPSDLDGKDEARLSVDDKRDTPTGSRKSSSADETSATIKAVEEERLSVLERVKLLEQQLQLLRGNDTSHSCCKGIKDQRKRTCEHATMDRPSPPRLSKDSSSIYHE